jgi:hypothetical protein
MKFLTISFLNLLMFTACKYKYEPQEGDLLFQSLNCGPLCNSIENVEEGINNTRISHVGILVKGDDEKWYVAEALDKVKLTPLSDFLSRSKDKNGNPKVIVGRIKGKYKPYLTNLKRKLLKLYNKPYDDEFKIGNDKFYCCELVYEVFTNKEGKHLFNLKPMTFKNRVTGKIDSIWINYFHRLNKPIPEGKPGCNPANYSKSDKIYIIYTYGDLK